MTFTTSMTIQQIGEIPTSSFVGFANFLRLQHIEFDMSVYNDITNVIKKVNAKSVTIHVPYLSDYGMDLSSNNSKVDELVTNINKYKEPLNVLGVVVHPPEDPKGDVNLFYDRLEKLPYPMLENMPNLSWNNFTDLFNSTEEVISNELGFCFDIPHSFITNQEKFLELPSKFHDLVFSSKGYIHTSGGSRTEDTHFPLLTDGDIPFNLVKKFLKPFTGIVTMELAPRNFIEIEKMIISYQMMLGVSSRRLHKLEVRFKRPLLMWKIRQLENSGVQVSFRKPT